MIAIIIIIVLSDLKWLASKKKTGIFTNRNNNPIEKEEQKKKLSFILCSPHARHCQEYFLHGLLSSSQKSYEVDINVTAFFKETSSRIEKVVLLNSPGQ